MTVRPVLTARPGRHHSVPVVGAALVTGGTGGPRLLACRRVHPPALATRWELPGGKVDAGESWGEALHRELREELGIGVRVGQGVAGPLPDGTWPLPRGYRMGVWLASATTGIPIRSAVHDELRWLAPDEVGEVAWLPGDEPVIASIARLLRGPGACA